MKIKIEDYILLGGTQVVRRESIATQTPFFTGFFASQNYSVSPAGSVGSQTAVHWTALTPSPAYF